MIGDERYIRFDAGFQTNIIESGASVKAKVRVRTRVEVSTNAYDLVDKKIAQRRVFWSEHVSEEVIVD